MASHILALGVIQVVRGLLGLAVGVFFIYRSFSIPFEWLARIEKGDQAAFLAIGILLVLFALVRAGQGLFTVFLMPRLSRGGADGGVGGGGGAGVGRTVRKLGIIMGVVDLIDLTLFPITTACGTYALLIYRHPESRDYFEGVFSKDSASGSVVLPAAIRSPTP